MIALVTSLVAFAGYLVHLLGRYTTRIESLESRVISVRRELCLCEQYILKKIDHMSAENYHQLELTEHLQTDICSILTKVKMRATALHLNDVSITEFCLIFAEIDGLLDVAYRKVRSLDMAAFKLH